MPCWRWRAAGCGATAAPRGPRSGGGGGAGSLRNWPTEPPIRPGRRPGERGRPPGGLLPLAWQRGCQKSGIGKMQRVVRPDKNPAPLALFGVEVGATRQACCETSARSEGPLLWLEIGTLHGRCTVSWAGEGNYASPAQDGEVACDSGFVAQASACRFWPLLDRAGSAAAADAFDFFVAEGRMVKL
jgi:hypothetical protein